MNIVILTGNVGIDPEVKHFESGRQMTRLTLATQERYKKDGETQTTTDWHNLVFWGKVAEIAEKYVKKGSKISIVGKSKNRSYEGQDGQRKYIHEVVVDQLELLDKKGDNDNSQQSHNESSNAQPKDEEYGRREGDDGLPF